MSKEVLSRAQHDGHGGDEAVTKYGASPATNLEGLRLGTEKYGGEVKPASEGNYSDNKSVKFDNNGIVGD